jgi:DmsE family decaheme c-type cytochrome
MVSGSTKLKYIGNMATGNAKCSIFIALLLLVSATALQAQDYSSQGADSCLPCHAEGMPKSAAAIFFTKHASRTDSNAPFANLQCETCHGAGQDHVIAQQRGEDVLPLISFGSNSETPVQTQNRACLDCHETQGRLAWFGSRHETQGVACASCHQVHRPRDRVFDSLEQQQTCFACHPKRRADTLKSSSHPLRFGNMSCSDCHDPHNGDNDFLLQELTVNETCYTCHAEKQGPYLWEHAPASENCSLCHQPHGSNHAALLKKRAPLLCQQCHSPQGHPSTAYTSDLIEDEFSNRFMLGRACLNCHSQVHGSNHPSGATLHR